MARRRTIEVFSAGCPVCENFARVVQQAACPSCDVVVRDMSDPEVADRARQIGVQSLPAVAVDGRLAACCSDGGPDLEVLRQAGLGSPR